MIVLVLGKNGQLGCELVKTLGSIAEVKAYGRDEVDITDKNALIKLIDDVNPDVVVNAVAYTAVDQAETEREIAFRVNAEAVNDLAELTHKRDIYLIHYSTDYVFDGCKLGAYTEIDDTNPINVYGESKLAGEKNILSTNGKHLIFRTTWVIGEHGNNFAKTIIRLAQEKDELNIIKDQIGAPTSTLLISKVTLDAIQAIAENREWPAGIYNLAPTGKTSWFGVAKKLLATAEKMDVNLKTFPESVHPILSESYKTPAKRPANSVLSTAKLQRYLLFPLPAWEIDFEITIKNIIRKSK